MAGQVVTLYKSVSEIISWNSAFANDLPDDTSLDAIASGSEVTAFDSAGNDDSGTIISNKTISGMNITFDISAGDDGDEYVIRIEGGGAQTGDLKEKLIKLVVRDDIPGGL